MIGIINHIEDQVKIMNGYDEIVELGLLCVVESENQI